MATSNTSKRTVEYHTRNGGKPVELFNNLRDKILALDTEVKEVPTNPYVGYKLMKGAGRGRLFVEIHIQIKKIELHLRPIDYVDTKLKVRLAADTHLWTMNRLADFDSIDDAEYAMELIKQSFSNVDY
jgi:predicted transport protein